MENFTSSDGNLYLGIDAGMFKTSVCTGDGKKFSERSIAAFPEENNGKTEEKVVSGKEALELTDGNIKEVLNDNLKTDADAIAFEKFLRDFLSKHDIDLQKGNSYALIGVRSNADKGYKKNLMNLSRELFSGVMLVDEPFCMAYKYGLLEKSMVVDIGFNRTDICVINGNKPQDVDCTRLTVAGKDIDSEIVKLIKERWPDSKVTEELAREWKEKYGYLDSGKGSCVVDIPLENETIKESIADEIQLACEFVVTDIVSGITKVLSEADPAVRESLRNNIHICGGISNLANIGTFIENELKELGGGKVFLDLDSVYGISEGALELARNMPSEFWKQLVAEKQNEELIA